MSAKGCYSLMLTLLLIGAVRAQDPSAFSYTPVGPDAHQDQPPAEEGTTSTAPAGPSSWITYVRPCCCGPVGGGPIRSELYLRSGVSIPLDGGAHSFLGRELGTGWEIQGGGRSLFFNPKADRAWTMDISLANIHNDHERTDAVFPFLGSPFNPVAIRSLNRTFVSLGLGHEWWLLAPESGCWAWRAGVDFGGRWGSARLDLFDPTQFSDYRRLNRVMTGIYGSLHTDVEIPRGAVTFLAGFRAEWDYTFLDFVDGPGANSDLESINLLVTVGARF